MSSKFQTRYVCQQCGRAAPQPLGKCPQCGAWDAMIEEVVRAPEDSKKHHASALTSRAQPEKLRELQGAEDHRLPMGLAEFARVLGGGIVPGSIVLVGGDPGIGKSTLLLQAAAEAALRGAVLYVSGEESARQIKMRADRLARASGAQEPSLPEQFYFLAETDLENILEHAARLQPALMVIDSIQTMLLSGLESAAGSVTQVRECASRLREFAKHSGTAVFLVGHVTKEGVIAGPRVLEHIVDTVLQLEGDRFQSYRLLRAVKNRFGPTSEVGVFEMRERGMQEVPNPSEAFLAERLSSEPGSAVAVTMEGTRPLLVEVQALTSPTVYGNPRRNSNGLDISRLLLAAAVLTRRLGLRLGDQDVFLNIVGGLTVEEPAADLAAAAAIASSFRDIPVSPECVLIGEVGLSGELRRVSHLELRLREAARLGFTSAIVPRRPPGGEPYPVGIQVREARTLREALGLALQSNHTKQVQE